MLLQIVIPVFNEQDNLDQLYARLSDALSACTDLQWQLLFVNDGSSDQTLARLQELHRHDGRVKIVNLSRNFGHQAAITAGLSCTDADAVVVIDGDLQDPPEIIPSLVEKWREGAQVVVAARKSRSEKGFRRVAFESFHRLFGWVSDTPMARNTGVFGLMDRRVVEEFNKLPEQNRFLPGLRSWVGFEVCTVYYDRDDRAAGAPKQTFRNLFRYGFDAIFSFSYKPLRGITLIGVLASVFGLFLACFFAVRRLLDIEIAQTGFTTLVVLILLFGGIQLISIGVLGEYIARIYDEVKRRPLFVVKDQFGFDTDAAEHNRDRLRQVGESL